MPRTQDVSRSLATEYSDETFLKTEEAADFLRIAPGTLRNLVCNGRIQAWKFRRRLLFKKSELSLLINKR